MTRLSTAALALILTAGCSGGSFYQVKAGQQVDSFSQVTVAKVDVLWVIDNSPSMGDKQANVHQNLSSFFHYLLDAQVDFHIGVTTTDTTGSNAGQLVPLGNPVVITNQTPNALAAFQTLIDVGTMGNALDKELDAARLVLTVNPPGFIRSDAYLFIIWVSDQEDASYPGDPLFFYRYFKSYKMKGNDGMVNGGAITGDLPTPGFPQGGCFTPGAGEAPPGYRVTNVVQQMGGLTGSICSTSFADILDEFGVQAVGLQSQFVLSSTPDLSKGPITVIAKYPCSTDMGAIKNICQAAPTSTCGGGGPALTCQVKEDKPDGGPGFGWQYNATTNSIVFDHDSIPPKGTQIEAIYYPQKSTST
jgi:hypothetical protein